jgi:hypothetical protein
MKELNGKVPVVFVDYEDKAKSMYGTITHNRARGTHLLEPMKNIVKDLIKQGKTIKEISKQLGMSGEEIYRLSEINKDKFLKIMGKDTYSNAKVVLKY